ncbi:hypothetical protein EXIGLDRAFT_832536 [Exidia glandulosa HHB12029]|uniref:ZZ-type domain-containing protein n=1 Tax=Exidia glandulosa HHB12029 TaxID=1314781 RepID=A0A165LJB3_EXIGL|nr:hypothetical protein EXIGLDRAFT_832536 [Exidia glandulosa HHB12029]
MAGNEGSDPQHQPLVSLSVEGVELFGRDRAPKQSSLSVNVERAENALESASDRVQAVHAKWQQNSDVITAAATSFGNFMESELAKKSARDVLGMAKKVIGALDCIQSVHPFVGVAVVAFKAIISFEVERRENERRVSGLIVQGTDMMVTILQLNGLPPDPKVVLPGQQTVQGRLQTVLDQIVKKLQECGNAIDKYYKVTPLVRFARSHHFGENFMALAKNFADLKTDVLNALTIRTAVRMEDAISTIDKIYEMILTKSEQEKHFEVEVRTRGGLASCLNDSNKMLQLATAAGENMKVDVTGQGKGLSAAVLYDLRTPLEGLLDENRGIFDAMLKAQTSEIESAIKTTETRLLHAFSAGAYENVIDPHIRYVWKVMKWSLSVETPFFIAAVYDHFAERFAQALRTQLDASDPHSHVPPPSALVPTTTNADTIEEQPPPVSIADEWCLAYLDIFYVPALKEAFDDDTNGLVNVREVNSFSAARHLPEDWQILRRLVYAAAGWHVEMCTYCAMVQALLNKIVYLQDEVLPANRALVCSYLNSEGVAYVKLLTRGVSDCNWATELIELAGERMSVQGEQLRVHLADIKYEIPSDEFVPLYFGKGRIEQYLLPLVFSLLRRHVEIIMLARTETLDRRELGTADSSLMHVMNRALARVQHLEESFNQQGINPKTKFKTFAKGLYRYLSDPDAAPNDVQYWRDNMQVPEEFDIDLSEITVNDLRYGIPTATWPGQSTAKMDEYIELAKLSALDSFRFLDGPSYLPPEKAEAFVKMKEALSGDELVYCDARADLNLRETTVVHSYGCNGCRKSPLIDSMFDCLDCGDGSYQLCAECAMKATDEHDWFDPAHTLKHNMMRYSVEISLHRAARMTFFAQERLRFILTADEGESDSDSDTISEPEGPESRSKAASHVATPARTCSNCNVGLVSTTEFYCCVTCFDMNSSKCFLCSNCVNLSTFTNDAAAHTAQGHWIALIRDLEAPSATGRAAAMRKTTDSEEEEMTVAKLGERVDVLQNRVESLSTDIEKILTLVQALASTLQPPPE